VCNSNLHLLKLDQNTMIFQLRKMKYMGKNVIHTSWLSFNFIFSSAPVCHTLIVENTKTNLQLSRAIIWGKTIVNYGWHFVVETNASSLMVICFCISWKKEKIKQIQFIAIKVTRSRDDENHSLFFESNFQTLQSKHYLLY
jgi:hypothetical protein